MPTGPFGWTHEKTQVQFDGQVLTINGRSIPLDQIDHLASDVSTSTAQGSWGRIECRVALYANGKETRVRFHGDGTTEEWGPWRPMWDQLEALVHEEIEPRLLERTISQVAATSSAEIVPLRRNGRGRLTVTAEALQARTLFSKPIPWKEITGISDGLIQIFTTDPSGKQHKHNTGHISAEWDAWQIPLLWHHYAAG